MEPMWIGKWLVLGKLTLFREGEKPVERSVKEGRCVGWDVSDCGNEIQRGLLCGA